MVFEGLNPYYFAVFFLRGNLALLAVPAPALVGLVRVNLAFPAVVAYALTNNMGLHLLIVPGKVRGDRFVKRTSFAPLIHWSIIIIPNCNNIDKGFNNYIFKNPSLNPLATSSQAPHFPHGTVLE